jgi:hypothetical protein
LRRSYKQVKVGEAGVELIHQLAYNPISNEASEEREDRLESDEREAAQGRAQASKTPSQGEAEGTAGTSCRFEASLGRTPWFDEAGFSEADTASATEEDEMNAEQEREREKVSETRPVESIEFVDQVGPDEARRIINEAIEQFAAASRAESWARRRERILRLTRILEQRLDYDLERVAARHR